ncbi:hypothetical protein OIB37_15020 [Streptomyces sp. NBC_00820]|uniref:hypothetical protein n=1 Tax=Streptomyces sp. NBC_00820 TaxID=2975842 RepID=UPI002ED091D2|nr:hypothetical protein OIB37_15020 [Streptomyces sp. NBC_00820]
MPRPTAAQLAYGSSTVILSTLAMLLLSQTSSGLGITVIALSALALGLLVAMTVPLPAARTAPRQADGPAQVTPVAGEARVRMAARREPVAAGAEPARERTAS